MTAFGVVKLHVLSVGSSRTVAVLVVAAMRPRGVAVNAPSNPNLTSYEIGPPVLETSAGADERDRPDDQRDAHAQCLAAVLGPGELTAGVRIERCSRAQERHRRTMQSGPGSASATTERPWS